MRDALALDPYRLIARSNGKTVDNVEWAGRMVFAQGDGPVKMSFYQVGGSSAVCLIVPGLARCCSHEGRAGVKADLGQPSLRGAGPQVESCDVSRSCGVVDDRLHNRLLYSFTTALLSPLHGSRGAGELGAALAVALAIQLDFLAACV